MKKNFTLTELIISIVVIGILAAIVMLNISDLRLKAEETARAANEREVQTAVDRYKLEYGKYPTNPQPSKDTPQLVDFDEIVPEFLRTEPKGDYIIEVDDKGSVSVKAPKNGVGGGTEDSENPEETENIEPPYVKITACAEAEAQGYTCINNEDEFNAIRNNLTGKYILMNDINLSKFVNWEPIGTNIAPFDGILNGNEFTVSNMNITNFRPYTPSGLPAHVGLFGTVTSATFEQLTLSNFNINNSDTVYGEAYTGSLIGSVQSNDSNNSDRTGLIVKNVTANINTGLLTTTTSGFYTTHGGLIGTIDTNSNVTLKQIAINLNMKADAYTVGGMIGEFVAYSDTDPIDVKIQGIKVEGDIDAMALGGHVDTGAVVAEIDMSYLTGGSFTLKDIYVNADIKSNDVAGVIHYFDSSDSNITTVMEDIEVNGEFYSRSAAYGFAYELYLNGDSTVRNIDINANRSAFRGDSYGFGFTIDATGENVLIENITVDGTSTGSRGSYGFMFYAEIHEISGNGTMQNIVINSNQHSTSVNSWDNLFGFAYYFEFYENSGDISILDIEVSGDVTGPTSYGFAHYLDTYSNSGNVVFSNILISGDISSSIEDVHVVWSSIDAYESTGDVTLNNFTVSGVTSAVGDIYGYSESLYFGLINGSGKLTVENIHLNGLMNSTGGSIYPFIPMGSVEVEDGETGTSVPVEEATLFILQNNSISTNMTAPNGTVYPAQFQK